jgi:hypothetical protein
VSDPLGVLLGEAPCVTDVVVVLEIDAESVNVVLPVCGGMRV